MSYTVKTAVVSVQKDKNTTVVINQHTENQIVFRGNVIKPGNSSYSDVTSDGKKINVISYSIPKGMREFNQWLESVLQV